MVFHIRFVAALAAGVRFFLLGAVLVLISNHAVADTLHRWVKEAARAQQDIVAVISQQPVELVFIGQHEGCSQVAVLWRDGPQQNFEVCGEAVRDKRSVAPVWPVDSSSRTMLAMVVNHALRRGRFQAMDPNGYLISAERHSDVGSCATISVNISYAGDLVDRDVRRICD